jgi:FkbM family methyltransferase
VRLVASLCDPNRVSLDIGADVGEFAIAMLASSRSVIAFEPRPAQAHDLASMFDAVGAAVRVEAVALSDEPGVTTMRVVEFDAARHQNPANIGGREDGWAARGVYVNNFVFVPKGA